MYLRADRTTIENSGDKVVLSWKTENADSITINNGVGSVTPVAEGSVDVFPTGTTNYVATVAGDGETVDCNVRVTLEEEPPPTDGPSCVYLRASDESIEEGQEITLSWKTERATSISINQGIGEVTPVAEGSIRVSPNDDTTYVATVRRAAQTDTCQVSVNVDEDDDDDDDDDDDGGGGGGRRNPRVVLGVETVQPEPPLSFVYLSEMPYTGLDLGPIGTAVYWLMLIGWSAAAAYLFIFNLMPFALRRVNAFGSDVHGVLNSDHGHEPAHDAHVAESSTHHAAHEAPAPSFRGYTSNEGFRSFAQAESLTIDDIVKGLSRETQHAAAPAYEAPVEPVIVPGTERIQEEAPAAAPMMEVHHDVPAFIEALLSGDRDQVFGMLRQVNRTGGDSETFVTHAVCALDDAYRSRLDGTPCHPEVLRATEGCATPFLERVIASLATAVDSSYSTGVTGAKLALTRALAVVNG